MYKKLISFAIAIMLLTTTTIAATGNTVPEAIVKDLNQHFTNVSEVRWSATNNYYKASLNMQGKFMEVFYNLDGSFIGISRNITLDQLPLALIKDVQAEKANAYVAELFELVTDQAGTEYYITYKNGLETKVFRGAGDGWNLYQQFDNE
ncbi:hypothetical protein SAMN05444008_111130 [Cnuella takakiae]|uniref:Uncharacterized protein n=1 Tax=Cnuella takakiae TaxID=1302690 RepID=A0A1M5DYB7_9BACT|nr:hypothetical protein [Cnuella takakiae]OLY93832.1 hypothetical protein BUE76_19560 [Cnuella takakiae]SHF71959.1 hypothetical protein SAMN05444008_111130 [Cnuella takakiae]